MYTAEIKLNNLFYQVIYKGKTVILNSPVSLFFKEGNFADNINIASASLSEGIEKYSLVVGKAKNISDQYKQLVISLQQTKAPFLKLNIVVRAFNDGLAFRYELPQWKNQSSFTLLQENTSFNISGNPLVRTLLFDNYTSSHEGVYEKISVSNIPTKSNARFACFV